MKDTLAHVLQLHFSPSESFVIEIWFNGFEGDFFLP
jgi:hypothetical protein